MSNDLWLDFGKRLGIVTVMALALAFAINEGFYRLLQTDTSRGPEVIELIIPLGTAEEVAAGRDIPTIPEDMVFVIGDTLLVQNKDTVDHELGPLWIPAGRSATLLMELASDFAYTCSFSTSNYLGLTVREATTWETRLAGLWYSAPPLAMFFLVYSYVVFPIKNKKPASAAEKQFHPEWGWREYEDKNGEISAPGARK